MQADGTSQCSYRTLGEWHYRYGSWLFLFIIFCRRLIVDYGYHTMVVEQIVILTRRQPRQREALVFEAANEERMKNQLHFINIRMLC